MQLTHAVSARGRCCKEYTWTAVGITRAGYSFLKHTNVYPASANTLDEASNPCSQWHSPLASAGHASNASLCPMGHEHLSAKAAGSTTHGHLQAPAPCPPKAVLLAQRSSTPTCSDCVVLLHWCCHQCVIVSLHSVLPARPPAAWHHSGPAQPDRSTAALSTTVKPTALVTSTADNDATRHELHSRWRGTSR